MSGTTVSADHRISTSRGHAPLLFPRGLLGFEDHHRYVLQSDPHWSPLRRLESVDDRTLSFVLAPPRLFASDYHISVDPQELAEIGECTAEDLESWVIVTIPDDPSQMSVNLQGPLIINHATGRGKQLVLTRSHYSTRHQVFDGR